MKPLVILSVTGGEPANKEAAAVIQADIRSVLDAAVASLRDKGYPAITISAPSRATEFVDGPSPDPELIFGDRESLAARAQMDLNVCAHATSTRAYIDAALALTHHALRIMAIAFVLDRALLDQRREECWENRSTHASGPLAISRCDNAALAACVNIAAMLVAANYRYIGGQNG
jgi:hypothetical protein